MKGFTHFTVGLAAASCFPAAIHAAATGNPLYFILGGAFGILPDTLDFKFYRFFVRHDMQVIPDPDKPDPQMIADAVAYAINRAFMEGKPVKIRLSTIPVGADRWQQYTIRFDVASRRVVASYGDVVDTGQNSVAACPSSGSLEGSAQLACPIVLDYEATVTVDIFEGPLFTMKPAPGGMVRPEFIGWHREWSHGLLAAGLLALAGWALFGWTTGVVILAAYGAHIVADQLGFMGSNLLFPFTRKRTNGFGLLHSSSGAANAITIWLSCLLIFWNLYSVAPGPVLRFNAIQLFVFAGLIPIAFFSLMDRLTGPYKQRSEIRDQESG